MGGAGGSLRAGVTENPVRLTRSVKEALTTVTCGGAPVYVWPGGGITFMVDVTRVPENAFGYVPTPALVAPIEFTMRLDDYAALGGHMDEVRPLSSLRGSEARARNAAPRQSLAARRSGAGRSDEGRARRSPSCPTVAACICSTGRSTSSSRPSARATPSRAAYAAPRRALRRPCSTSFAPNCPCCARRPAPVRARSPARSRGGCMRRSRPSRRRCSSRRWRRSPARWRRTCSPR